jgi:SAM-dependent methyltransferase
MTKVTLVPRKMTEFDPNDKRKKCLNIGSGIDYKPSNETELWVNVDMNAATEPDVVCRAEELSLEFHPDTFDEVHLIHVLEHCQDSIKVMEEIWAVMKDGGRLVSCTPYYTGENAMADPTHVRTITPITYAFFSYPCYEDNAKRQSHMSQLFPKCDFDITKRVFVPLQGGETFRDEAFAIKHYFNVVDEMQIEMICVKPIRMFDIKKYQTRTSG